MPLDAARCYRAILSRDRRFDGRFFAGVLTTGVYCRPICPSRPPRAVNVRFFACAAAAEAARFRPCRRCHPAAAPGTPAWNGTSAIVSRGLRLIGDRALDDGSVESLAARLGVGSRQLRRLFLQHLGAPPARIAAARRVHFAATLLADTRLPISQVAFASGFGSLRRFNDAMRATFGCAPREMRRSRSLPSDAREGGRLAVRLSYRPPLDWTALLGFFAARAVAGVEEIDGAAYRRAIEIDGQQGFVEVTHDAPAHHLIVRLHSVSSSLAGESALRGARSGFSHTLLAGLPSIVERVRRVFDLNADPMTIAAHLCHTSLREVGFRTGIRVPSAWDPFELAVRAVLGQRISVRAATTLAGRVAERFGQPCTPEPGHRLSRVFPAPATLVDADLEAVGVSVPRAHTIRHLARAMVDGTLRLDATQGLEDAVARLDQVPGIGPWTAHYIAMRALGEPDAFPASDLGLRKAGRRLVEDGTRTEPVSAVELERLAEAWRPWRAYAAMTLWGSLQQTDGSQGSDEVLTGSLDEVRTGA